MSEQPKRVLICGSRDWTDGASIRLRLIQLPAGTEVIHGAAEGADTLAEIHANLNGMKVRPFVADWSVKPDTPPSRIRTRKDGRKYDVAAGIQRNLRMLDERPDLVIAFQRNGSSGTQHTIDEARRRGIPVEVHSADQPHGVEALNEK